MYGRKHSQETIEKIKDKAKKRPKRIWINNGKVETCIPESEKLPDGFFCGRIKFKNKEK